MITIVDAAVIVAFVDKESFFPYRVITLCKRSMPNKSTYINIKCRDSRARTEAYHSLCVKDILQSWVKICSPFFISVDVYLENKSLKLDNLYSYVF